MRVQLEPGVDSTIAQSDCHVSGPLRLCSAGSKHNLLSRNLYTQQVDLEDPGSDNEEEPEDGDKDTAAHA